MSVLLCYLDSTKKISGAYKPRDPPLWSSLKTLWSSPIYDVFWTLYYVFLWRVIKDVRSVALFWWEKILIVFSWLISSDDQLAQGRNRIDDFVETKQQIRKKIPLQSHHTLKITLFTIFPSYKFGTWTFPIIPFQYNSCIQYIFHL